MHRGLPVLVIVLVFATAAAGQAGSGNSPPTAPTGLLCDNMPCANGSVEGNVSLGCFGSIDPENDQLSYSIEFLSTVNLAVPQDWWNAEYKYRKPLTITNPSPNNLELTLDVDLTDPDFQAHAQPDLDDVRIINTTNQEVPFDLVEFKTKARIKTSIEGSSYETFFVYYGNPLVTSTEQQIPQNESVNVVHAFAAGSQSSCYGLNYCWDQAATHQWVSLIGTGGAFGDFPKSGTDPRPPETSGFYWSPGSTNIAWLRLDLAKIERISALSQAVYNDSRVMTYNISVSNSTSGPWLEVVPSGPRTKITTFDIPEADAKHVLLYVTGISGASSIITEELEAWNIIKFLPTLGQEEFILQPEWNVIGTHSENETLVWDISALSEQSGIDLRCRAIDPAGSNTYSPYFQAGVNITIVHPNIPPTLFPIGGKSGLEGQPIAFQLSATDPDNDTLTFSTNAASVLPTPFAFNSQTGAFNWTPGPVDYGNYTVTFSVTDGINTTSEGVLIAVQDAQTAQLAILGAPQPGNTIQILLSDPPAAGKFYVLALALGTDPPTALGDGRAFPLSQDTMFWTSLQFPGALGLANSVGILNPSGNAQASWTIPKAAELKNKTVFLALATLDFAYPAPKGIISVSAPRNITISG